jgi:hypothetical protein
MQRLAGNRAVLAAIGRTGGDTVELLVPRADPEARDDAGRPRRAGAGAEVLRPQGRLHRQEAPHPQAVVKNGVSQLLGRMAAEGRLMSKDPVATIVAKIFPGPGG